MKPVITAVLASGLMLLASCSFLPQEDEPLPAPVARAYETKTVTYAVVTKGDLIQTKSISAVYRPVVQETYGFSVSGILIEGVYVGVGDSVKKGDLLAELDRKSILAEINDAKIELQKQKRQLEYARQNDIAVKRETYILGWLNEEHDNLDEDEPTYLRVGLAEDIREQEVKLANAVAAYASAINFAEKQTEVAAQRIAALEEMAAERAIYASIDGIVTQIKNLPASYRSAENDDIITVSDVSETAYTVSGTDAELFTAGKTYQIKIGRDDYDAVAVAQEKASPEDLPVIFFRPVEIGVDMASYGSITIELDRKENVLYLPSKAIKNPGGVSSVYYIDENGLRAAKPVETGLRVGGRVEIVSGLSEGDEVIIE